MDRKIYEQAKKIHKEWERAQRHFWTRDTVDLTMLVEPGKFVVLLQAATKNPGVRLGRNWDLKQLALELDMKAPTFRVPVTLVIEAFELGERAATLHELGKDIAKETVEYWSPERHNRASKRDWGSDDKPTDSLYRGAGLYRSQADSASPSWHHIDYETGYFVKRDAEGHHTWVCRTCWLENSLSPEDTAKILTMPVCPIFSCSGCGTKHEFNGFPDQSNSSFRFSYSRARRMKDNS